MGFFSSVVKSIKGAVKDVAKVTKGAVKDVGKVAAENPELALLAAIAAPAALGAFSGVSTAAAATGAGSLTAGTTVAAAAAAEAAAAGSLLGAGGAAGLVASSGAATVAATSGLTLAGLNLALPSAATAGSILSTVGNTVKTANQISKVGQLVSGNTVKTPAVPVSSVPAVAVPGGDPGGVPDAQNQGETQAIDLGTVTVTGERDSGNGGLYLALILAAGAAYLLTRKE